MWLLSLRATAFSRKSPGMVWKIPFLAGLAPETEARPTLAATRASRSRQYFS
jgi:hypothetical protein